MIPWKRSEMPEMSDEAWKSWVNTVLAVHGDSIKAILAHLKLGVVHVPAKTIPAHAVVLSKELINE